MTASELHDLLPKGKYHDLRMLVQDTQRVIRSHFKDFEHPDREREPFSFIGPDTASEQLLVFRPEDTGTAFVIRIVGNEIHNVIPQELSYAEWLPAN